MQRYLWKISNHKNKVCQSLIYCLSFLLPNKCPLCDIGPAPWNILCHQLTWYQAMPIRGTWKGRRDKLLFLVLACLCISCSWSSCPASLRDMQWDSLAIRFSDSHTSASWQDCRVPRASFAPFLASYNFVGTLVGVFLLSSLFLWHLSTLLHHSASCSHILPSEIRILGEYGIIICHLLGNPGLILK